MKFPASGEYATARGGRFVAPELNSPRALMRYSKSALIRRAKWKDPRKISLETRVVRRVRSVDEKEFALRPSAPVIRLFLFFFPREHK